MRVIALFVVLMVTWVLLSGHFTAFHLGAGVACSALVTWLTVRMGLQDAVAWPVHLPRLLLRYVPWLLWRVALANFDVAFRVWHPRLPIRPRLVRVPLHLKTGFGTMLYANSITLTPGTVTVAAEGDELVVHALSEPAERELRSGAMHDFVRSLEKAD